MSRHYSHITTAVKIIESATPGEPSIYHLKKSFAADKKYGSKDRKAISSLCYNYYRIGNALPEKTTQEKIIAAAYLCTDEKSEMLAAVAPELNEKTHWSAEKKCAFLKISPTEVFPYAEDLSPEIDPELFAFSFLIQPLLFLRIRPGKALNLFEKLTEAKIPFQEISTSCIALSPASKLDDVIKINKEAVVQDRNSQLVFNYLQQTGILFPKDAAVWDCCAASGGKSILLCDNLHGHIDLTVSDVRGNILLNLQNRFKEAGIKNYYSFIADLEKTGSIPPKQYDLIICDAPCTGSGTWARTPEQLSFFNEERVAEYSQKQKTIASAVIPSLKKGGLLFYITCSVFKKENEDIVEYLKEKFQLQLLQLEYLKGYEMRADTMFVAVLKM